MVIAIEFYVRLTLADVIREVRHAQHGRKLFTFARMMLGWRSNLRIAYWQWRTGGNLIKRGRYHELIHVSVDVGGDTWESTFAEGVHKTDTNNRHVSYPQQIIRREYEVTDTELAAITAELIKIEGNSYDAYGAALSVFNGGINLAGEFCSEVGALVVLAISKLPTAIRAFDHRRGHMYWMSLPAASWSPSELALELDMANAYYAH